MWEDIGKLKGFIDDFLSKVDEIVDKVNEKVNEINLSSVIDNLSFESLKT
ncbi:MAG: hypothetical protein ACR5KW_01205 [Wolbachia sp.]